MAAITRDYTITYNSIAITTVLDVPSYMIDGETFHFAADFLSRHDTIAAAKSAWAALETGLNIWNAALTVASGGQTLYDHTPSTNTGFLTRGVLTVPGSDEDTLLSRRYHLEVRGSVPGTETGEAGGLKQWSAQVTYDTSRRATVAFTMEYTSTSGPTTAQANWDNGTTGAKKLATTYMDALVGATNYELTSEGLGIENKLKTITGTVSYTERLIPEADGGGANANFVITGLSIKRGTTPSAARIDQVTVSYDVTFSCAVDQTGIAHGAFLDLYEESIKPFLLDHLADVFTDLSEDTAPDHSGKKLYIVDDQPNFQTASSRIDVQWTVEVPTSGSNIRAIDITSDVAGGVNEIFRKVLDGTSHSFAIYTMAGPSLRLTERFSVESYQSAVDEPGGVGSPIVEPSSQYITLLKGGGVGRWRWQNTRLTHARVYFGMFQTNVVPIYKRTFVREWVWIASAARTDAPVQNPYQQQFTEGE